MTGENGSGKSTLVELVAGYLHPTAGSVVVAGRPASAAAARDVRRVCRTRPALFARMTVRDHLTFAARCAKVAPEPGFSRAAVYGLGHWLTAEAGALSTGNAKKLSIVMCTLGQPELVVLDEPYNGLDKHGVDVLDTEVRAWAGMGAVVMMCHQPPPSLVADHILRLRRGGPLRSRPETLEEEV